MPRATRDDEHNVYSKVKKLHVSSYVVLLYIWWQTQHLDILVVRNGDYSSNATI